MDMSSAEKKYIIDELGRKKTLLQGKFAFISLDFNNLNTLNANPAVKICPGKKNILLLGLGCCLEDILPCCQNKENIFFIESPQFSDRQFFAVPKNFRQLSETELLQSISPEFTEQTDILLYKQNLQLFPRFWNKILIALRNRVMPQISSPKKDRRIFLSGSKNDLLHKELVQTISDMGYIPQELGNASVQEILELADRNPPSLYLSINAQSLDKNGIIAEFLRQNNIPLALWFVDNPWNILSDFSQDWWKDCPIFLTDFSFAPKLSEEGAKKLYPLPLASHSLPAAYQNLPEIPLFFVGNSAFANKQQYFSGCRLEHDFEQQLYACVKKSLENKKELPSFHAIQQTLIPAEGLWLNKKQRLVSYAAAKADLFARKLWLEGLSPLISIMGDNAWQDILQTPHTFYAPVNYYSELPSYYRSAFFTLNLTSLLMPGNLSQRHFDVWKHHGFLLSSPSPGMNIFTSDLVSQITVRNPQDCLDRLEFLLTNPNQKKDIQNTMQNDISQNHTYKHRLQRILETV